MNEIVVHTLLLDRKLYHVIIDYMYDFGIWYKPFLDDPTILLNNIWRVYIVMVNLYDCTLAIEELKIRGYLDISELKEKNLKNIHKFIQFLTRNEIVKRRRNRLLLLGDFPK
ncbi:Hypothetical Protein SiL_0912 [Sulfolobus islandicus LAL14/1]|uniref:Uncharacterized protein n=1 Tax=Saccharolobus islandicus LAL14/1 TaxID=1241935 RepID=M9UDV4_SACIS|nr:Hypothetical Protein SiL_0912 [Sulfolobus islandicus LAL14/1]